MPSPLINDVIQTKLHENDKEVVRKARLELGTKRRIKYNDGTVKNRRMVSTGNLQKSIGYVVTAGGVHSAISFFMETYGYYLDAGVSGRKYKVQGGSPYSYKKSYSTKGAGHQKSIRKWMDKKGIKVRDKETGSFVKQTEAKRNNLAYFIAKKIKERGLPKTEFFSLGFDELYQELPAQLQFLVAEEVEKFLEDINFEI